MKIIQIIDGSDISFMKDIITELRKKSEDLNCSDCLVIRENRLDEKLQDGFDFVLVPDILLVYSGDRVEKMLEPIERNKYKRIAVKCGKDYLERAIEKFNGSGQVITVDSENLEKVLNEITMH